MHDKAIKKSELSIENIFANNLLRKDIQKLITKRKEKEKSDLKKIMSERKKSP